MMCDLESFISETIRSADIHADITTQPAPTSAHADSLIKSAAKSIDVDRTNKAHISDVRKSSLLMACLKLKTSAIVSKNWSGKRDSNSRHLAWEASALPTELFPQNLWGA